MIILYIQPIHIIIIFEGDTFDKLEVAYNLGRANTKSSRYSKSLHMDCY